MMGGTRVPGAGLHPTRGQCSFTKDCNNVQTLAVFSTTFTSFGDHFNFAVDSWPINIGSGQSFYPCDSAVLYVTSVLQVFLARRAYVSKLRLTVKTFVFFSQYYSLTIANISQRFHQFYFATKNPSGNCRDSTFCKSQIQVNIQMFQRTPLQGPH